MLRLLGLSAPGVVAICSRLTVVKVVEDCGSITAGAAETSTVSLTDASGNWKCTEKTLPDDNAICCCSRPNPLPLAETRYWPRGTEVKRNSPFWSVFVACFHS